MRRSRQFVLVDWMLVLTIVAVLAALVVVMWKADLSSLSDVSEKVHVIRHRQELVEATIHNMTTTLNELLADLAAVELVVKDAELRRLEHDGAWIEAVDRASREVMSSFRGKVADIVSEVEGVRTELLSLPFK